MAYRVQRGPVASPRRGVIDRRRMAAPSPGHQNGRLSAARPVTAAEAAQARLFEGILRDEIAEFMSLPPEARGEQRARVQEVDRLLVALRDRFPQSPPVRRPPQALLN